MNIIFVGPSISISEAKKHIDAVFLPPVSVGDIVSAAQKNPTSIGIIDGYFDHTPSVWHKEILWALTEGIAVYGSSSMGALRAAELHSFGMKGVGKIFDLFHTGVLEDDDEVALTHLPKEGDYLECSEAMVNIRITLDNAVNNGVISQNECLHLTNMAKIEYYPNRNYPDLLAKSVNSEFCQYKSELLSTWLLDNKINQKKLDAIELLKLINSGISTQKNKFRFNSTKIWESTIIGNIKEKLES